MPGAAFSVLSSPAVSEDRARPPARRTPRYSAPSQRPATGTRRSAAGQTRQRRPPRASDPGRRPQPSSGGPAGSPDAQLGPGDAARPVCPRHRPLRTPLPLARSAAGAAAAPHSGPAAAAHPPSAMYLRFTPVLASSLARRSVMQFFSCRNRSNLCLAAADMARTSAPPPGCSQCRGRRAGGLGRGGAGREAGGPRSVTRPTPPARPPRPAPRDLRPSGGAGPELRRRRRGDRSPRPEPRPPKGKTSDGACGAKTDGSGEAAPCCCRPPRGAGVNARLLGANPAFQSDNRLVRPPGHSLSGACFSPRCRNSAWLFLSGLVGKTLRDVTDPPLGDTLPEKARPYFNRFAVGLDLTDIRRPGNVPTPTPTPTPWPGGDGSLPSPASKTTPKTLTQHFGPASLCSLRKVKLRLFSTATLALLISHHIISGNSF